MIILLQSVYRIIRMCVQCTYIDRRKSVIYKIILPVTCNNARIVSNRKYVFCNKNKKIKIRCLFETTTIILL